MSTFGTASTGNPNPNNSFEVAQPPSDSVSNLCFSLKANHLVATSWDNQVRCWEIMWNGNALASAPKASISHDHPVMIIHNLVLHFASAALSFVAGGVFGWTFGQEIANHSLQL